MSLHVGGVFADRYTIEGLLGEGGMGSVYRVYDATLDRRAALKVVRVEGGGSTGGSGASGRARLLREARSAAAFTHPNAVAIYDVGEVEGVTYIAMELIDGRSLRTYVDDRAIPLSVRIGWLRDIASALAAAHRRGIIHRDVKPENVMITQEGAVKVLDFGIARRVEAIPDALGPTHKQVESLTAAGTIVGTPLYMAPEQIHGEELDARVDQFAWGVTAHELLTGELPWGRERNTLSTVADMFSLPPRKARDKVPDVPEELESAILRALARSPRGRFETMDDLIATFAPEASRFQSLQPSRTGNSRLSGQTTLGAPRVGRRAYAIAATIALAAIGVVALVRPWRATHDTAPPEGHPATDANAGHAITDTPPPRSDHPDALDAYKTALRDLHACNLDAARDGFEKAVARDPDLAAAHLRLLPIALEQNRDPAPAYRHAIQLRDRLSERDRDILDAYAPLIETDPADYNEVSRRFAQLAARYANDAEIADDLARVELLRFDGAAARRAVGRALALDPDDGDAWMMKVETERTLGRFEEANRDADECFTRFAAIDCLVERSLVAQFTGANDALAIARKQQALSPDSLDAAKALAGALFVSGAEPAAVRVAFQTARASMSQLAQDSIDARLAILAGSFTEAHRLFERARDETPMIRTMQAVLAWMMVNLDEEMGDSAMALHDAETFAASMPAFASARAATLADPVMPVFRVLRDHGKLSPDEYARKRAEFVAAGTSQVGADGRALVWLAAYAEAARTADDAKEALAAEAQYGEPKYHYLAGAPVGRVHLLAGDVLGALPDLERGARAADVFFNATGAIQARLDLGHALEKSGDPASACERYDAVLSAWGAAVPRSVSAADARERRRALGCKPRQ